MATVPDSTKQLIIPGYRIEELIFDRNSTRIYRATRLADSQSVMLKSLCTEQQAREQVASLKHEYDIGNQFDNQNVISVYGMEWVRNVPVVVLEDFGGSSLSIVTSERTLLLQEVLAIAIQVAQGLGEIHRANVIHKDINPSNVVYNPGTRQVKIIDFGISSYLTREQVTIANPRVVEASLPYVSPEQTGRMNRSVDYRSDYYSFGVTLFELLTGKLPFQVNEPNEWFHCHIAKQPPAPIDINPSIPKVVSDLVMKLMSKMAEQRYQSAVGIQADLQRCLDQLAATGSIDPFQLGQGDINQKFHVSQLVRSIEKTRTEYAEGTTRTEQLANIDITALMKALKAIAEEKSHGHMMELILSSALEFAAAQHGMLILRNTENQFLIEGEASITDNQKRVLQSIQVTAERLPLSLFNYVVRTQTSLVIHDAQVAVDDLPGLAMDPYIQQHAVRSVLCLPIVSGRGEDRELIGLLYLENNLAVGAFTQERFNTLEIIGMPGSNLQHASMVAERICNIIEIQRIVHDGNELRVTISLGLCMLSPNIADKDELIRRADEALYQSKENGRNQVTVAAG